MVRMYIWVLVGLLGSVLPMVVNADGLVPCGGPGQEACQTCHAAQLVNNVIEWLLAFLGVIAVIAIVYAGTRLVISGGNRHAMEEAKSMMSHIIIGYMIILAAWLLVDTGMKMLLTDGQTKLGMWNEISCVVQPEAQWVGQWDSPELALVGNNGWESTGVTGWAIVECGLQSGAAGMPTDDYDCSVAVSQCISHGGDPIITTDGSQVQCAPKSSSSGSGGSCSVIDDPNNACYPGNLTCFGNPEDASKICNLESSGGTDTAVMSGSDICQDGKSFSGGLWQINMLANNRFIPGCSSNFYTAEGSYRNNSVQGSCLDVRENSAGIEYCAMFNCRIIDESMYQHCKSEVQDYSVNTNIACQLYAQGEWGPWQTSAKTCGIW